MKLRTKLIVIAVLLVLSLGGTVYAARAALSAVHNFTVQQELTQTQDVQAVRPWMTVPYIARTYRVPTSYLYESLGVPEKNRHFEHATLHIIASQMRRPVNEVIRRVQRAIITYRQQHSPPVRVASKAKLV